MGKRITSQKRGRGTRRYIAPSHRYSAAAKHKSLKNSNDVSGRVMDIIHSVSHDAPLAVIKYDDGEICHIIAPDGIAVGDVIVSGKNAPLKVGSTLSLVSIP